MINVDARPNLYINAGVTMVPKEERIKEVEKAKKVAEIEELIASGLFGDVELKSDLKNIGNSYPFDLTAQEYNFNLDELL